MRTREKYHQSDGCSHLKRKYLKATTSSFSDYRTYRLIARHFARARLVRVFIDADDLHLSYHAFEGGPPNEERPRWAVAYQMPREFHGIHEYQGLNARR